MLENTQSADYRELYARIETLRVQKPTDDEVDRILELTEGMQQDVRDALKWKDRFEQSQAKTREFLSQVSLAVAQVVDEAASHLEQK